MKDEYSFISSKKSYIVQNNGRPASFIVLDADNYYNALNRNAAVLRSYKKGKLYSPVYIPHKKICHSRLDVL